jgi:hypothetical protein
MGIDGKLAGPTGVRRMDHTAGEPDVEGKRLDHPG